MTGESLGVAYISTGLRGSISGRPKRDPVSRHSVSLHLGMHFKLAELTQIDVSAGVVY